MVQLTTQSLPDMLRGLAEEFGETFVDNSVNSSFVPAIVVIRGPPGEEAGRIHYAMNTVDGVVLHANIPVFSFAPGRELSELPGGVSTMHVYRLAVHRVIESSGFGGYNFPNTGFGPMEIYPSLMSRSGDPEIVPQALRVLYLAVKEYVRIVASPQFAEANSKLEAAISAI